MSTNAQRHQSEILQDRFGLRLAARLNQGTDALPHDISERLRTARMQALGKRKLAAPVAVVRTSWSGGAMALGGGDEPVGWWGRIAAVLPLVVLLVGLVTINAIQNDQVARELAAVDAALLTDDLPPSAYADPGFARFVQLSRRQAP